MVKLSRRNRFGDRVRRRGPAPDDRYERLNPGAKARRHALAPLPVAVLRDYAEQLLWDDFRAGRFPNTRAIPSLAHAMAQALKHGAYAMGITAMADITGVSTRTVIRGSKAARERAPGGRKGQGYLWRKRGRKGEGVTIWRPAHALVDAITVIRATRRARRDAVVQAKAERADLQRAIASVRDTNGANGSQSQCDTTAHVAAPWAAGRRGGSEAGRQAASVMRTVAEKPTTKPDIPDKCTDNVRESVMAELRAAAAARKIARARGGVF